MHNMRDKLPIEQVYGDHTSGTIKLFIYTLALQKKLRRFPFTGLKTNIAVT